MNKNRPSVPNKMREENQLKVDKKPRSVSKKVSAEVTFANTMS